MGCGKTTFANYLSARLAEKRIAMPILIECAELRNCESVSWDEVLTKFANKLNNDIDSVEYPELFDSLASARDLWLAGPRRHGNVNLARLPLVLILDGLDQIDYESQQKIGDFVFSHAGPVPVLLTSRPAATLWLHERNEVSVLRLARFSKTDRRRFFGPLWERVLALNLGDSDMLEIPILAQMVHTLVTEDGAPQALTRSTLYQRYLDHVVNRHHPNRIFVIHEPEEAEAIQESVSFLAYKAIAASPPNFSALRNLFM